MSSELPEVWLRGRVDGYESLIMPVVHALLQASEDIDRLVERVPADHVWLRPGGAASIGFHIRHTGGALDRLFTYARGEMLSDAQKAALRAEEEPGDPPAPLRTLADQTHAIIQDAYGQLRTTRAETLL